ncbi:MAG: 2-succinyl-5-enolpyruvyl-6-hydroxy-3-cyclohexene-1-carboxylic-acid synthase [Acidimicrobiia bacterium]
MHNRGFAFALASALADLGIDHVCISPGSRNTPLIAGFAAEPRIKKWVILDERSAGFFALGLARATGVPVALACTSGTAAVEYHPAVVEAGLGDVPLLVLTADRPEELRGRGAPQTIDQISLYGTAVRMFADALAPDEDTAAGAPTDIAIDIWAHATAVPPGPVHLNLPFREPLLARDEPVTATVTPLLPPATEEPPDLAGIAGRLEGKRGVIVAGRSNDVDFATACSTLAAALGFPVFADPLSGLRFGAHDLTNVLGYGDRLAAAGALDELAPEVVLRFGPVPTSKPIWQWLEDHPDVDQILIDTQSRDATDSASTVLEIEPTIVAAALGAAVGRRSPVDWLEAWRSLDTRVAQRVDDQVTAAAFPNEPAVARAVAAAAPPHSAITLGSSMPIRDVDAFGGKSDRQLRVFGNRGANGIDGLVSTALGAAAAGLNSVVLLGDVALFHDLNALGTACQLGLPITIVVVNNNGGGIFHFLPQNDPAVLDPAVFETFLATPHGTDFPDLATAFGIESHDVTEASELGSLIAIVPSAPRLIQVSTDRTANVELHRRITRAVRELIR